MLHPMPPTCDYQVWYGMVWNGNEWYENEMKWNEGDVKWWWIDC